MHAHGVGAGLEAAPDNARVECSQARPVEFPVEPPFGSRARGAGGPGASGDQVGQPQVLPGQKRNAPDELDGGVPLEAVMQAVGLLAQLASLGTQPGPLPGAGSASRLGPHLQGSCTRFQLAGIGPVPVPAVGRGHGVPNTVVESYRASDAPGHCGTSCPDWMWSL